MPDGFSNKPKILRGAFVEFGLSVPPLLVVFQFNPLQLTRNRGLTYPVPQPFKDLRELHRYFDYLGDLSKQQIVTVGEQTIGFEIRLDATDKLNDRDPITENFGIAPQLATLELMTYPKGESLLGAQADKLLTFLGVDKNKFSFTRKPNPPLILFIWGRKRVLPVNITAMNITETEFSIDLNPIRATVAMSLTVIESNSLPYLYSKAMTEAMSALNLANIAEVKNVVNIPG
jgi:hypothetical protein